MLGPVLERSGPSAGSAGPSVESTRTSSGSAGPSAGSAGPVLGVPGPVLGMPGPVLGMPGPVLGGPGGPSAKHIVHTVLYCTQTSLSFAHLNHNKEFCMAFFDTVFVTIISSSTVIF